jgi:hypothetical protein
MGAIENIKEIADLVKKLGDIDLYRKIIELEQEIFDLSRKNLKYKEDIDELKGLLSIKQTIKFSKPFYFIEGDQQPYCPKCWEVEKVLVHLTDTTDPNYHHCPNCDKTFGDRY